MIAFFQYIKGYVRIKVWGFSPERFMNLCSNHNILLWDIVKDGDVYFMSVSIRGFKQLRPIVRKTGTRVAILQRHGLPFFMSGLKKRKIFILGLLLCVSFWIFSSFFIWDIELEGNYQVTEDIFLSYLQQNQITVGMKKKDLDIENLEKDIRREFPVVTWTSARLDGTKLVIQIKENETPPVTAVMEEEGGKDLAAPFDGRIVSMIVRNGVPKVAIGDEITAGMILVEGKIPIYNEDSTVREYQYVAADADIYVEHAMTRQETLPFDYIRKEYTGRTKVKYFLRVGNWEWKLSEEQPFLVYDSVIREKVPVVFEKLSIPVMAGSITYREYQNVEHTYTTEEAKSALLQKINDFFQGLSKKGVQIIEKDVKIEKGEGEWVLNADLLVRERAFEQVDTPLEPEQANPQQ